MRALNIIKLLIKKAPNEEIIEYNLKYEFNFKTFTGSVPPSDLCRVSKTMFFSLLFCCETWDTYDDAVDQPKLINFSFKEA